MPASSHTRDRFKERLRFALRYAIRAPSGHNTQPWRFRIAGDGVEIYADRSRILPVVDPVDRALVIRLMPHGASV